MEIDILDFVEQSFVFG